MAWGWGSINTQRKKATMQTYIRNLPYSVLKSIADDLDVAGTATNWRDFVLKIPRSQNDPDPRYDLQDIRRFEMIAGRGESPTTAALDAWSTTNATVQDLINLLNSLGLISMVNELKSKVMLPPAYEEAINNNQLPTELYQPPRSQFNPQPAYQYNPSQLNSPPIPPRPSVFSDFRSIQQPAPSTADSAKTVATHRKSSLQRQPTENDSVLSVISKPEKDDKSDLSLSLQDLNLDAHSVSPYSYSSLRMLTADFDDSLKLGEGAFGSVFQGHLNQSKDGDSVEQRKIAIKRLKLDAPEFATAITEQFKKEVQVISELQHENILPLMGYACDGPELCLVYDYMYNGSLSSSLESCRNGKMTLLIDQRLEIGKGSANGITYLHEQKLIHRDIKSSNILLDSNMKPRISDFGLIRSTSTSKPNITSTKTSNPIGTMVYMSPDAYRGVVSYSMDVFSFGVVLLELLTGMPVLDDDRDPPHLTMYVEETMEEEESSIEQFCDPRAGEWPDGLGETFYDLTKQCLENKRNRRPTMKKVFTELSEMCNSQSREE